MDLSAGMWDLPNFNLLMAQVLPNWETITGLMVPGPNNTFRIDLLIWEMRIYWEDSMTQKTLRP